MGLWPRISIVALQDAKKIRTKMERIDQQSNAVMPSTNNNIKLPQRNNIPFFAERIDMLISEAF